MPAFPCTHTHVNLYNYINSDIHCSCFPFKTKQIYKKYIIYAIMIYLFLDEEYVKHLCLSSRLACLFVLIIQYLHSKTRLIQYCHCSVRVEMVSVCCAQRCSHRYMYIFGKILYKERYFL